MCFKRYRYRVFLSILRDVSKIEMKISGVATSGGLKGPQACIMGESMENSQAFDSVS